MKQTPLYDDHLKLNAEMIEFFGWEMPIRYTTLVEEHEAVRNEAGLFDVSHMGEIRIKGNDAGTFVQKLFTNDISKLVDGQVIYGFFLNEKGTVVDDLLVYRVNPSEFLLVVNASNVDKDYEWVKSHQSDYDVEVINESDDTAEVALQGPKAQEILQKLTDFDLNEIKFFHFVNPVNIAGVDCLVSRTGYTGEDGFEIYTTNDKISQIWNEILKAGEGIVKPTGLGCRDTLRFEASLPLYGNELSDKVTPVTAGFGFFVSKEADFIGSDVIRQERADGSTKKIVGLEVIDRGIVRQGNEVFVPDGDQIGEITTGYFSPTLKKTIALALIDAQYAKIGEPLEVKVRNRKLKAKQISKKFLQKKKDA